MSDQLVLQLPYEEIKTLASRDYLRKRFTITSKTAYTIQFKEIQLREGFIKRQVFDVEELAELLFSEGQKTPFDLDVLPDGRVFLFRGRRRYAAYMRLIEQGRFKPETPVPFFPTEKHVTELDRMVDQITYNHHSKDYTPLEQSAVVWDLKHNFGKISNDEIGSKLGISRQKVDYLLLIAAAGDDLKNEILKGDMSLTDAVNFLRKQKQAVKQSDKGEENSHKNSDAATPLPKDLLKDEVKELKKLDEQAEGLKQEENDDEETEEVRMTNPEAPEYKGKDLKLVGNTAAVNEKPESEIPGAKKFDEGREEIGWCQNLIKNLDWLSVQSEKLPDQTSKDFVQRCNWLMKDAELIRDWVQKNKRENKRGR